MLFPKRPFSIYPIIQSDNPSLEIRSRNAARFVDRIYATFRLGLMSIMVINSFIFLFGVLSNAWITWKGCVCLILKLPRL